MKHGWLWLCLGLLLLAGCQQPTLTPAPTVTFTSVPTITPSPSATPRPFPTRLPTETPTITPTATRTPGPSPTSTPQPPLGRHEWQPAPVLVRFSLQSGPMANPLSQQHNLVLYATGQLIVRICEGSACRYAAQMLSRGEVCALLNAVDQQGFLDADPAAYNSPQSGGQQVVMEVNAWRSNSVTLDGLDRWLHDPDWLNRENLCNNCMPAPEIAPSLANTFFLLERYEAKALETYAPERLALWLSEPWIAGLGQTWPLDAPTLTGLEEAARCPVEGQRRVVVVEGRQAVQVAEMLNRSVQNGFAPVYSEGGLTLQVMSRWLLPLEAPAGCGELTGAFPEPSAPAPAAPMHCGPADGQAPIATATPTPRP